VNSEILERLEEIEDHMEAAKKLGSPPTSWHDTAWLCEVVRKLMTENVAMQKASFVRMEKTLRSLTALLENVDTTLKSILNTLRKKQLWILTEWRGRLKLIELASGAQVYVDLGKFFDDPWTRDWRAVLRYAHPDCGGQTIAGFDTEKEAESALLALANEVGAFSFSSKTEEEK